MVSASRLSRYHAVVGVVQLLRPVNVVLSVAGVLVGAYLGADVVAFDQARMGRVLLAALSAAAVTAAANSLNDAFDVKVDQVNRPKRPIPSGKITESAATRTWLFGALVGIGLSLTLSVEHVLIASSSIVLVYMYSAVLKRAGLIGNVVVSAIVSAAIIYGALATGQVGKAWIGVALAFLLTLSREITKDLEDVEGDVRDGVQTLPVLIGDRRTRLLVVGLIVLTIIAAPMPFLLLTFDRLYLLGIAAADFCLLGATWFLWVSEKGKEDFTRASLLLKSAMVAGMGALLLG